MAHIDTKDKKILSVLDMDARIPLSKLAKQVGLSRDVVNYRIRKLEQRKIIEGYYTVIDVTKIGMIYCRTFFKYRSVSSDVEKEILEFCRQHKHITWVIFGEGKYNLSIMIITESMKVIEKTIDEMKSRFGRYLQNAYVTPAFRIWHYKHNFLYDTQDDRELIMGEGSVEIDDRDRRLIELLSGNARATLIELSKQMKSTPKSMVVRIRKLVKNRIILAFRAKINTRLLGYDTYKVFLTLQSSDKKLLTYLKSNPNVVYATKPMGTHQLEFEIMLANMNELHEQMREMQKIVDIVDYDTNLYYDEPMVKYFPG